MLNPYLSLFWVHVKQNINKPEVTRAMKMNNSKTRKKTLNQQSLYELLYVVDLPFFCVSKLGFSVVKQVTVCPTGRLLTTHKQLQFLRSEGL